MPDYQKGKIYRIWDKGYNKCYIGSTCEELSRRFSSHKRDYKRGAIDKTKYSTSWQLFDEYGVENCIIELIEKFPCNSKEELHAREGNHQREIDCVNKNIAGRSLRQYNEDEKDKIRCNRKQYYENNKEVILQRNREYRQQNNEHIKEQRQNYYQEKEKLKQSAVKKYCNNLEERKEKSNEYYKNNKLKILSQWKEPWTCDCGTTLTKKHKSRHLKSLKHQQYINQASQQTPENSS